MAPKRKSPRGRKQDRARVAGGQNYEVGYEARKTRVRARRWRKPWRRSATAGKGSKGAWAA